MGARLRPCMTVFACGPIWKGSALVSNCTIHKVLIFVHTFDCGTKFVSVGRFFVLFLFVVVVVVVLGFGGLFLGGGGCLFVVVFFRGGGLGGCLLLLGFFWSPVSGIKYIILKLSKDMVLG